MELKQDKQSHKEVTYWRKRWHMNLFHEGLSFHLCNFIQLWEIETYYNGEPLLLKIPNPSHLYGEPIYNASALWG